MKTSTEFWGWTPESPTPIAAYIHVPFCRHRCGYCNFSLLANRDDLFDRFLDAIEIEFSWLGDSSGVSTLFLGGGTPSILSDQQLSRLTLAIRQWLPLHPQQSTLNTTVQGEWSIEANPLDITHAFCERCKSAGINRISIGAQSFQVEKLNRLERDHSPKQLIAAIELAKENFDSVSIDLIFGAPQESLGHWLSDVAEAITLEVDHVSTYGLTYEKGAKFWGLKEKGLIAPVEEDIELLMYEGAIDLLESAGFEHYEVSNFCKPGHACLHNLAYWRGERWWAFGPSAARFVGDTRSVNHRSTLEYLKRVEHQTSPVAESELLTPEQVLRERFVFGMRMRSGIPWETWKINQPVEVVEDIDSVLQKHMEMGWMAKVDDRIALTRKGLVVSDGLWGEYL